MLPLMKCAESVESRRGDEGGFFGPFIFLELFESKRRESHSRQCGFRLAIAHVSRDDFLVVVRGQYWHPDDGPV